MITNAPRFSADAFTAWLSGYLEALEGLGAPLSPQLVAIKARLQTIHAPVSFPGGAIPRLIGDQVARAYGAQAPDVLKSGDLCGPAAGIKS